MGAKNLLGVKNCKYMAYVAPNIYNFSSWYFQAHADLDCCVLKIGDADIKETNGFQNILLIYIYILYIYIFNIFFLFLAAGKPDVSCPDEFELKRVNIVSH